VGVGVSRLECDRPLVRRDRLVEPEPILEDDPEVAVPVRPLGLELEAPLDQSDGLIAAGLLVSENPREVQGARIVGRDLEDRAVELSSRRPLLALLQRDRDRQRFVEAQRAVVAGELSRRDLPLLVGLEVVLEVKARIEGSIRLLRTVFDIDLRKGQAHGLNRTGFGAVGVRNGGDEHVVHLDDEELLLALAGLPKGDRRLFHVLTGGAAFHQHR
jgi:hypothetical protein